MSQDSPLKRRLRKAEIAELIDIGRRIGWNNHELCLASWSIEHSIVGDTCEVEAVENLLILLDYFEIDISDYGPKEEPNWTIHLWEVLHYRALQGRVVELREVLSEADAYEIVVRVLHRVPTRDLAQVAFLMLQTFRTSQTLDWIEKNIIEVVSPWYWGYLAAVPEFSWDRAMTWLERGRPLSLVALDALANMGDASQSRVVKEVEPRFPEPVSIDSALPVLERYALLDPTPRVHRALRSIIRNWNSINK